MKLLLDTHIFFWLNEDASKLSKAVKEALSLKSNIWVLSVVSVWELQIKSQIGKLALPAPLNKIVETNIKKNRLEILPVTLEHALAVETLRQHHKDPFDRLIIAQAIVEDLTVISYDSIFSSYGVKLLN